MTALDSGSRQLEADEELSGVGYRIERQLAGGAFGSVYLASNEHGVWVAVKRVALCGGRRGAAAPLAAFREISSLRHIHHKHVISLLDVHFSANTATLVLEYAQSDLRLVIESGRRRWCRVHESKYYFSQIFEALDHIHGLGIMHRDIKPENVLLDRTNHVKLADFGQACLYFPDNKRSYGSESGTLWYRAPELLFGETRPTPAVDIWAAGCMLAEFAVEEKPIFQGSSVLEQLSQIFRALGPPTDETWPGWRRLPDSEKFIFEPVAGFCRRRWEAKGCDPPCLGDESHAVGLQRTDRQISKHSDELLSQPNTVRPADELYEQDGPFADAAALTALIDVMLQLAPEARPSASECLRWLLFPAGDVPLANRH